MEEVPMEAEQFGQVFSSSDDSSDNESDSSDNDDDDSLQELDDMMLLLVVMAIHTYVKCIESFQSIELSRENGRSVNPLIGVHDVYASISAIPQQFKDLTNFWPGEYHALCARVCPIIQANARSTGVDHVVRGRPCKLTAEQRLLNFILYLKHDNSVYLDAQRWNWCRSSVCDDSLFVASCINQAIANEIKWPNAIERQVLARTIPQLPGCIGFIDATLCRIRRPFQNPYHKKWFQGRKKMYCMNSTVLVDHNGLFIYVDAGYPGSYHDVTILQNSMVEVYWRQLFMHTEEYCEYVLGDSGYVGKEKYIMRGFTKTEMRTSGLRASRIKTFNKMISGHRVKVEWGIGGLKMKWRRLQKQFDLTKQKFSITFRAAALLTNFLHMRQMDMSEEIVAQGTEMATMADGQGTSKLPES